MNRPKMDRAERAKQFLPFDALKGFRETLAQKERIVVERAALSEEYREELDRRMQRIRKNDIVTVVYFHDGEYVQVTGMVSRLDVTSRILRIVNTKIAFEDIYEIRWE